MTYQDQITAMYSAFDTAQNLQLISLDESLEAIRKAQNIGRQNLQLSRDFTDIACVFLPNFAKQGCISAFVQGSIVSLAAEQPAISSLAIAGLDEAAQGMIAAHVDEAASAYCSALQIGDRSPQLTAQALIPACGCFSKIAARDGFWAGLLLNQMRHNVSAQCTSAPFYESQEVLVLPDGEARCMTNIPSIFVTAAYNERAALHGVRGFDRAFMSRKEMYSLAKFIGDRDLCPEYCVFEGIEDRAIEWQAKRGSLPSLRELLAREADAGGQQSLAVYLRKSPPPTV